MMDDTGINAGVESNPMPGRSIAVEHFTEAAFRGVMRAIAAQRADPEPSPWRQNPILIYGIIALPQQVTLPQVGGPGEVIGEG